MTRAGIPPALRHVRSLHRAATRALSLSLVVVILAAQAPATPRPLGDLAADLHSGFKFWFHSSGWAKTLSGLASQSAAAQPESQSDRNARVASIKAFPGDVTMQKGSTQFYDALAFESNGQQVGGVKFTWRAEFEAKQKPVWISQTASSFPLIRALTK